MNTNREKKIKLIVAEEYSLAREVALGITVMKPLKAWLYIIPGMFIVDFLRRGKEIRRYGDYFMFPRKLALEAVRQDIIHTEMDEVLSTIEKKVVQGLTALRLLSEELKNMYIDLIKLLIEHYEKLMKADGNTYAGLLNEAYSGRDQYEAFLNKLSSLERKIDNTIADRIDSAIIKQSILLGQKQLEIMRDKHTPEYF